MRMAREYAGQIDLLLTDIVMPQMNGFELAKSVFAMRPEIKVLYMSGYTDNRVNAGWELEANVPFLHKPFTAAGLTQKVREALGTEAREASRL
jgi:YesN/AraC family two-component response regulator